MGTLAFALTLIKCCWVAKCLEKLFYKKRWKRILWKSTKFLSKLLFFSTLEFSNKPKAFPTVTNGLRNLRKQTFYQQFFCSIFLLNILLSIFYLYNMLNQRSQTRGPREGRMRLANIGKMKILKKLLSQFAYFSKTSSF